MSTVEKIFGVGLLLVALFLLLTRPQGVEQIFKSLAGFNTAFFGVLQGRQVDAYGVKAGGLVR